MSVRYTTVHANPQAQPSWVCYIDELGEAYVWVPKLKKFALNDAITDDLAWNQEYVIRDLSAEAARKLCKEGVVGLISDPSMEWVVDELAEAPSLKFGRVFPSRKPVESREKTIAKTLESLKANPGEPVVYATYADGDAAKASRAASDLRHGRVAIFEKELPGYKPHVEVKRTEDGSRRLVMLTAVPPDKVRAGESVLPEAPYGVSKRAEKPERYKLGRRISGPRALFILEPAVKGRRVSRKGYSARQSAKLKFKAG